MSIKFYNKNHNYPIELNEEGELSIAEENIKIQHQYRLKYLYKQLKLLSTDDIINVKEMTPKMKSLLAQPLTDYFKTIKKKKKKTTDDLLAIKTLEKFGIIETKIKKLEEAKQFTLKNCMLMGINKNIDIESNLVENFMKTKKLTENEDDDKSIDRIKIAEFIDRYKSQKEMKDYAFFREALINYGLTDEKEILHYYNDSIDSNYTTEEFKVVSHMKNEIQKLQLRIIEGAIEEGYLPPSDLQPFANPTLRKIEDISPENIDLANQLDFNKLKTDPADFENQQVKEKMSKIFKQELDIYSKEDLEPSTELLNLFIVKNNGINFTKMVDWANYSSKNDIVEMKKAYKLVIDVSNQCEKLAKIGILEKTGNGKYKFTDNNTRTFLGNNYNVIPNNLAKFMQQEFEKKDSIVNTDNSEKLLKEIKEFNFFYQMSNDPNYIKETAENEKKLMNEVKKELKHNDTFKDELKNYLHKNIDQEQIIQAFLDNDIDYFILKQEQKIGIIENTQDIKDAKQTAINNLNQTKKVSIKDFINLEEITNKTLNELETNECVITPIDYYISNKKPISVEECLKDYKPQSEDLSL